jgi:TolA-binding protein
LLYFFAECTIDEQRKKLSIPELKSWYEKISAEYGFTVIPKAGVLFDMAIDNKNENDSERAIALFRYLISLYPDSEIYYYFLGQTYLQKGDTENAKVCFSESLKINPEFKQAGSALEKLNVR